GGDPAKSRSDGKNGNGGGKDPAGPISGGHPTADGNEYREGQSVAGEHGFHAERGDLAGCSYGPDPKVADGGVGGFHENGYGHQPGQEFFNGISGGRLKCHRLLLPELWLRTR